MTYDSAAETRQHIDQVRNRLDMAVEKLLMRGMEHDRSKLGEHEKPYFDKVTPKLKGLTYGTQEYKDSLAELGPALTHHYAHNSHHPEHYGKGVAGMCLLDLVEMYCDWAAAVKRHADGDLGRSIEINVQRFKFDAQLEEIFKNTFERHGDFSS